MEVDFKILKSPGLLYVQGRRTMPHDGVQDFFVRIPQVARDAGVRKVLVDVQTTEAHLSTMQRFEYGTMLAEYFRGLQVAIVVNDSISDPDLFGETVAVNRGANIRVLTSLEEAQDWLGIESIDKTADGDT